MRVLNAHLQRYWKDHPDRTVITRSRPYHKNDKAHVEQKNRTLVCDLIGYDRLDKPQCVELLEDVYMGYGAFRITTLFHG